MANVSKRNIYNALIALVENEGLTASTTVNFNVGNVAKSVEVTPEDIKAFATHEIELIDNKNDYARAHKSTSKTNKENEPIIKEILDNAEDGTVLTAKGVRTQYNMTPAKASGVLGQMSRMKLVEKIADYIPPNGKAKDKCIGYKVVKSND